jgi:hypothetical protein
LKRTNSIALLETDSDSEDHFSDAQSGLSSPIPLTRVEKVDNDPSYGEVPGTDAYNKRTEDAHPDVIAVIPDASSPELEGAVDIDRPLTPGGRPIPKTVVEKIDPYESSHGEVSGAVPHKIHEADAIPDVVLEVHEKGRDVGSSRSRSGSTPGDLPIPITKVEKVDSTPSHGEIPGTEAYELRKGDAEPDIVEEVGDIPGKIIFVSLCSSSERLTESGSPTSDTIRSSTISHVRRKSSVPKKDGSFDEYNEDGDGEDEGFGDDFDDFEEGGEEADFDDFEDGFQEPQAVSSPPVQSLPTIAPLFVSRETSQSNIDALNLIIALVTDTIPAGS